MIAAVFLARKLREAFALQESKTNLYDALTKIAGNRVSEWKKMETDIEAAATKASSRSKTKGKKKGKKSKKVQSVYLLDESKGS